MFFLFTGTVQCRCVAFISIIAYGTEKAIWIPDFEEALQGVLEGFTGTPYGTRAGRVHGDTLQYERRFWAQLGAKEGNLPQKACGRLPSLLYFDARNTVIREAFLLFAI